MTTDRRAKTRASGRDTKKEVQRTRESLGRARKASADFAGKLPGIRARHAGNWIVFRNGRVAFKKVSFGKISDELKRRGWDKSEVIIEFVDHQPLIMIL